MNLKKFDHVKAIRSFLVSLVFAAVILSVTLGLFIGIFGWGRFLADFWPLDSSRVGPNLCASMAIVVLVTAHNEYRKVELDEEAGKKLRDVVKDAEKEALHPGESAEESVAKDVVEDQNGRN